MEGLRQDSDSLIRCSWSKDMQAYHDDEWGHPVSDDFRLFEKICLEGFQAGLSWLTIFRKRENFRTAFHNFDFHRIAKFDESDVERLVKDAGIIRHRGKIESTINNARQAQKLVEEEGSLAAWLWQFAPPQEERPMTVTLEYLRENPTTPASIRLSKALKKRGWSFVGPTTMHAFMQACGMVNDHMDGCMCREKVKHLQQAFIRPA